MGGNSHAKSLGRPVPSRPGTPWLPFLGYRSSQEALGRVRQTGLRESLLTTLRNIYKLWQKSGLCFAKQICPQLFHQLVSWGKHNLPFLKGLLNLPIVSRAAWHALSLSKFCFLEPRKSSSSKLSLTQDLKKKLVLLILPGRLLKFLFAWLQL